MIHTYVHTYAHLDAHACRGKIFLVPIMRTGKVLTALEYAIQQESLFSFVSAPAMYIKRIYGVKSDGLVTLRDSVINGAYTVQPDGDIHHSECLLAVTGVKNTLETR
jgi:hypothetical protein